MTWDSDTPNNSGGGSTAPVAHQSGLESPSSMPELSSAPFHWLYLGIASALTGLALPFVVNSPQLAVIGWLLGGIVSILLLATFIHRDTLRRSSGWARAGETAASLRVALLVLAAAAVVTNAWVIANSAARHEW